MCHIGCVRFAGYCGQMYRRHLFSYGGLDVQLLRIFFGGILHLSVFENSRPSVPGCPNWTNAIVWVLLTASSVEYFYQTLQLEGP